MRATAKLVNTVTARTKTITDGRFNTTHGAGLNGTGSRWQANHRNTVWESTKGEGRACIAYHLGVIMAYQGDIPDDLLDLYGLTSNETLQEWFDKGQTDGRHQKDIAERAKRAAATTRGLSTGAHCLVGDFPGTGLTGRRVKILELHTNPDGQLNGLARVMVLDDPRNPGKTVDIGTVTLTRVPTGEPYEITAGHVQELAAAYGENVLTVQPGTACLWVIATGNKHYDGAHTVYATGEQVTDLADDADYDEDGNLTDRAAWEIVDKLAASDPEAATKSARGLQHPDGYTARVMNEMTRDS